MLPRNRQGVAAILKELRPRIIGQHHEGFTCNCGAIHCEPATAVKICPAGDQYPGQETVWSVWSVSMSPHPENPGSLSGSWSCGLSEFVSSEELDQLFTKHFGDRTNQRDEERRQYQLAVRGVDRCQQHLPVAVRIMENDTQIRFSFDWGRGQKVAAEINQLYRDNPQRPPTTSEAYAKLMRIMSRLAPVVYRGGPDPEFPFEPKWFMNYETALKRATQVADHVFFQNISSHYSTQNFFTQADVVFMKVPAD